MTIIGERRDGVFLVAVTGTGACLAVNLRAKRLAAVPDGAMRDYATWPAVTRERRQAVEFGVRRLLSGRCARVALADVGPTLDERRQSLQQAVTEAIRRRVGSFGSTSPYPAGIGCYVRDIYDQADPPYLVYGDDAGKYFKWEYQDTDDGARMVGEPAPVEYVPVELRAQYEALDRGQVLSLGLADHEHPFTYCMEHIAPKADVDDPEAFCATMVKKATGHWPAEAKKND